MKLFSIIFVLLSFLFFSERDHSNTGSEKNLPPFYNTNSFWVDSVLNSFSLEQKIGQLFMVAAYSNKSDTHVKEIESLIKNHQIGGLMFMQGGPVRQLRLTNRYQSISKVPLMIAQDAEWGLSMRIDSTFRFPWQMTLGAIQNDSLVHEMGLEIARQCQRLGVHINFAPVVDVNSNPKNPIINNRSFGENPLRVSQHSLAYMKGLQEGNVLACAKHFPGHGDTDSDSHKTLPTLNHSFERLDSIDLVPFNSLIQNGLGSIMVAHLNIPSLDNTTALASTLSEKIVNGLLKDSLDFKGLVFTDALNMKGVSQYYEPGVVDLKALLAGNDVLLFAEDVTKAIQEILKAVKNNLISVSEIDKRCRKILMAKHWFGLHNFTPISENKLVEDLNTPQAKFLANKLFEKSLTVLQNDRKLFPLRSLDTLKIAAVCIGENSETYERTLSNYAKIDFYHLDEQHTDQERKSMLDKLVDYNLVLASVHKSNDHAWKSYRISQDTDLFLQTLALQSKLILSVFANPYSISDLLMTYSFDGLIMAYQNADASQSAVAQLIFGGLGANATLPVSNAHFSEGFGLQTTTSRIKYDLPEALGIHSSQLLLIDSIAEDAILKEATPGCQIMAIKNGVVFYNKSFGFHTYKKERKVLNSDLYDLASLTKIISTVPSLMMMVDNNQIDLSKRLSEYLELADTCNKRELTLKEILAHQSGLAAWIPFYKQTLQEDASLRDSLYHTSYSDTFTIKVAENIYLHKEYSDTIIQQILDSELNEKKYKYSDLGYYLFKDIIEKKYNYPLERLVDDAFYKPLGLTTMGYLPLEHFDTTRIVPTEFDYYYRSQLLQGNVHDMGAAMLGGIGGHAGLFSNANDLAIFMQMLLQKGQYGGKKYFKTQTVDSFTECQFCDDDNRRGAGFDKAALEGQEGGPACDCNPSPLAFGHSGFTGTLVWADPQEDFIYVFLSNRIHPTSDNQKLLKMDVRTKIMNEFYSAIRSIN
ncbi:MAG: glycoside hydrolase family 3 N-terminal domain-containing protein [Flavobacteriales bacterium]